jgi:hypothetical protein
MNPSTKDETGAVHFVLWSKPRYVYQFRCCHDCLPSTLLLGAFTRGVNGISTCPIRMG